MHFYSPVYILPLVAILLPLNIHALEKTEKGNPIRLNYITALHAPRTVQCTKAETGRIISNATNAFRRLPHSDLVSPATIAGISSSKNFGTPCYEVSCAKKTGKYLPADRVIIGSVKKSVNTSKRRLGEDGYGQYLIQKKTTIMFTITFTLYDMERDRIIARETRKTGPAGLNDAILSIAESMKKYYKTPITIHIPGIDPPETQKRTPITIDYAVQIEELPPRPTVPLRIGFYLSTLYPTGELLNNGIPSIGLTALFSADNLFFKHITLRGVISMQYLISNNNAIEYYLISQFGIQGGYMFSWKKLSLMPLMGFGYMIHIVSGDMDPSDGSSSDYENRSYFYPYLDLHLELQYHVTRRITIVLAPGSGMLFERGSVQYYATAHFGVLYRFNAFTRRDTR